MPSSLMWLILLYAVLPADIVWQGKKVNAWPAEAVPEISSSQNKLSKVSALSGMGIYPSPKGEVWGLTMLVDFSDQPAIASPQEIEAWLNQTGFNRDGCNGSIRDYFRDISNGQVDFRNQVVGYYRAKNPKSYYDGGNGYERASILVNEVLNYFDSLVDFSRFDNDKDGNTEAISIVYAGSGTTWGQGIWPHSGWIGQTRDRVRLTRYMMSDMPGKFSLYVFAHECGHMLFAWPDLYWFGDYCLMGNRMSDKNPVMVNDFFRADQGWIPVYDVEEQSNGTFLSIVNQTAYRYRNPARPTKEGFFWSNINNRGRNSSLRGRGILIYHYDLDKRNNSSADNLILRVIQADNLNELQGSQWPSPGSDARDFFSAATQSEFSSLTHAETAWYSGTASGIRLWNISAAGDTMYFKMGTGVENPVSRTPPFQKFRPSQTPIKRNLLGQALP